MQNGDNYKKESILQAFVSLEAVAAIVCMSIFWFTITNFDSDAGAAGTHLGDTSTADDIVEKANAMKPMQLAYAGNIDEAIREVNLLLVKKKHDTMTNLCAGNVFMVAGLDADGEKYLKMAVALSHRNKFVILNYADQLSNAGKADEAIVQYEVLANAEPDWQKPHLELAKLYLNEKRPADAAEQLKAVLKVNDKNFAARKLRGIALARASQMKAGLEEYVLATSQESQSGIPEALRTMLGPNGNNAVDRCVFELQQQINNRPDDYLPKLRLAQLYAYGGNAKEAKDILLEARRLQASNPEVQRTLAVVLKQLGEDNQALSAFGLSIKLEEQQEKERARKAQAAS